MRRPKGFSDAEMPAIVRLLGGLYGLDIASKLFEEHFSKTLTTMGFQRLISDPQVLIKTVIFASSAHLSTTP